MQKGQVRFYCILCTTVKHFGAVVIERLGEKCIREGGFFLAVGVDDNVFACKSTFLFFCVHSLLVPYPKLLQVKNAVNIFVKLRRSHVRMLNFYG